MQVCEARRQRDGGRGRIAECVAGCGGEQISLAGIEGWQLQARAWRPISCGNSGREGDGSGLEVGAVPPAARPAIDVQFLNAEHHRGHRDERVGDTAANGGQVCHDLTIGEGRKGDDRGR